MADVKTTKPKAESKAKKPAKAAAYSPRLKDLYVSTYRDELKKELKLVSSKLSSGNTD